MLRTPFFIAAIALAGIATLIELGSAGWLRQVSDSVGAIDLPRPGLGIPAIGLLDILLFYTVLVMGMALLVPERIQGRIQGLATLIFSILLLLGDIALLFAAVASLILMVTLLLAAPFGTIVYLAVWGGFDTTAAKVVLGLTMTLKLTFAACLVLAHQRFLQNKGLVTLVVLSLVATFALGLLHGFVPGVLVSITDSIGAVVFGIVVAVLAVMFLIGAIISVVKAIV
ncbi:MAG: hypothetical protein ABI818_04360 [Acidobacteriota bacterium]